MPKHKKTVIEYRNYILPTNFPVLLLSGNRWKISDIKSDRLHFHNCLEIGICHSDSGIMDIEDISVPFQCGDITCIPKNLPHTTYSNPGTGSLWSYIFFDPDDLFRGLVNNVSKNWDFSTENNRASNYLILNKDVYSNVHFLVSTVIDELKHKKTNYQSSVRGLLLSICVELFRIQETDMKEEAILQEEDAPENSLVIAPALDYIRKNYMLQFTIEDLSTMCHFSETHFRRVFHSIMGTSPLDYLNNTRIYKACSLLRSTEDPVLTISEQVGFHSVSSFNRYFQKVTNCSPSAWKKQLLQTESKSEKQSIWEFSGWV